MHGRVVLRVLFGIFLTLQAATPLAAQSASPATTEDSTLGNQLAFTHAAAGGRVLFATLLTESHDRMLGHLQDLSFFDRALVGDHIRYISLMAPVQEGNLDGTLRLLVEMLRDYEATLLVIDGVGVTRMFADSKIDYLHSSMGSIRGRRPSAVPPCCWPGIARRRSSPPMSTA